MEKDFSTDFVPLAIEKPIWNRFFTIAPLIVVGTKEGDGYDLAPKHMATPIGHSNYYGFVCTPKHATYHNVRENGEFTVSFPMSDQTVLAALSASPRCGDTTGAKEIISALPTFKANTVDALFIKNSYLYLECALFRIVDGFDDYSLITGEVKAAYVDKNYLKASEKDEQQQLYEHPLLAYLAHGRFAKVSKTFNFPFPKDFNF
ncbi:flavin reductase [Flavobacteriaceae bacterium TP-CH-4]|uniref:Flavin reductase n=1 Tax=Pelagihabitans pacificus TaxID=2696054 RepID=A0A967AUM4_9FLAO|nr:flavin reductase [Pelagihabitans pacificus]NHF59675.1 flavin reductase [Pelagihabitans pacificus]